MLDRIATWLFRRYRPRYIGLLEIMCDGFLGLGIAAPVIALSGYYFGLTRSELAITYGVTITVLVASIRVAAFSQRRKLKIVKRWLHGEPVDPEAVWQRLLVIVPPIVVVAVLSQTPVHMVVTLATLDRYGDFGFGGWVGTELGLIAVMLGGAVVILQGYQVLVRPGIEAVTAELPAAVTAPPSGLSIAARLTIGIVSASVCTGAVALAATARTDSLDSRWGVGIAAAVAFMAYVTVLYRIGLIDAALAPLRDVIRATQRVRAGDYDTPVTVTSADELGELAAAFNDMQRGLREREALQNAFSSYVDPALARRLLVEGDSVFEGEEIDVSVFFADIRAFTQYAEQASVRDTVGTLNAFFSIAVRVISEHGGHTNAYLGDGVLAVFGTPEPLAQHADAAVAAALELQQAVRDEFGDSLRIGIGVNTGRVIAGTVGGEGKLGFTVIGDPVNLASRVEQLTKHTGDGILVTEATHDALLRPLACITDRGEFDVRGTQRKVRLFSVV